MAMDRTIMNKPEIIAEGSELVINNETGEVFVTGEKGKGGGGGDGAKEANNTLRSSAVVKVVEVISEGPIVGICGGAEGILINNTPLKNATATYNFPRVAWDYRVGLPVQDYMPGFASASSEINIAAPILNGTAVVRSVSASEIDSAKVTILLPVGLAVQDTKTGDLNGKSVSFSIEVKLTASGSWLAYKSYTISGKTTSAYEAQYRVERPSGTGIWDIRVTRLTANSNLASIKDLTNFSRLTEIIDVKLGFEDTAVVGLAIDAESVGSTIPTRSYMVKGRILAVPTNYNPETRVYTGIWNGTFKQAWSNNPAWVLYDLLTHDRYGMGEWIALNEIDIYSFYDAAVYNDGLVSDGKGGTEPRFDFNGLLATQESAGKLLQLLAGSFRSTLVEINGKWTVLQDRPSSPVRIITNSNVEDGEFTYKSSGLFERHTAFNVTYNDKFDRYLQKTATVEDAVGIARYGYFPIDMAAYGATTEGRAIRHGKGAMDSELNQTELVTFTMGINGFDLINNDVFELFDEDYTRIAGEGRVRNIVGNVITLDKPILIQDNSVITVMLANGNTYETRSIVESAGNLTQVTVDTTFSGSLISDSVYVLVSNVAPRQFKVMNLSFPEATRVTVEAVLHDPAKYARIETGVVVTPPVYTASGNLNASVVVTPTDLTFTENASLLPDGSVHRSLIVGWTPAVLGSIATGYTVVYTVSEGNRELFKVATNSATIPANTEGLYEVSIIAFDGAGRSAGQSLTGTYLISSADSGTLGAVSNLYVKGTSGLTWVDNVLEIVWEPNPADVMPTQDYEVLVKTTGDVLLRRELVRVPAFNYSIEQNRADHLTLAGVPSSTLKITVTPRDLFSRLGTATVTTFTNPPPALVTDLTVFANLKSATIQWKSSPDPDVKGYLVWRGTTVGFTVSAANLVAEGLTKWFQDGDLLDSTTYYYKVAAYDEYSRNLDGTGLNILSATGATTSSGSNVNEYEITGVLFTPNSPSANSIAWTTGTAYQSLGTGAGTTWSLSSGSAAWTSGVVYIYYQAGDTILKSTTNLATAIAQDKVIVATYRGGTNVEVGFGNAYMDGSLILAGTIGSAQIVAGAITADKIASNSITAAQIAADTITANEIAANAITADKIDVTNLAAISAILGNVDAANITLGADGYLRLGQTAHNTGNGFWAGDVGGVPKVSFGEGVGGALNKGFSYDGATNTLNVEGELIATGNILNNAITVNSQVVRNQVTNFTSPLNLTMIATGKPILVIYSYSIESMQTSSMGRTLRVNGAQVKYNVQSIPIYYDSNGNINYQGISVCDMIILSGYSGTITLSASISTGQMGGATMIAMEFKK